MSAYCSDTYRRQLAALTDGQLLQHASRVRSLLVKSALVPACLDADFFSRMSVKLQAMKAAVHRSGHRQQDDLLRQVACGRSAHLSNLCHFLHYAEMFGEDYKSVAAAHLNYAVNELVSRRGLTEQTLTDALDELLEQFSLDVYRRDLAALHLEAQVDDLAALNRQYRTLLTTAAAGTPAVHEEAEARSGLTDLLADALLRLQGCERSTSSSTEVEPVLAAISRDLDRCLRPPDAAASGENVPP